MYIMKPQFTDTLAWQQAELLMQPAYIRIIDQIRKQLEESSWKGTYQEVQTPYPGYQLCLQDKDISVNIDLWDLCFQVCFRNYSPSSITSPFSEESDKWKVEIDTSLIDDDTNDVDWNRLDAKARQLVEQVFASLPKV
jgi:hypothetical protein